MGAREGISFCEKNGMPARAVAEVAATKAAVKIARAAWRMARFIYGSTPNL
jgi:hypothetical protein